MSDEYKISVNSEPDLGSLALPLQQLGLRELERGPEYLFLIYEHENEELVRPWGGNVRIERQIGGLFVILNGVRDRARVMAELVQALAKQGIHATVEEL